VGVSIPGDRPGSLADALRTGRFAVTAEIGPPRGADRNRNRIVLPSTDSPCSIGELAVLDR